MRSNDTVFRKISAIALISWATYPLVTAILYFVNSAGGPFYGYGDLIGLAAGLLLYASRWGIILAWLYVLMRLSSEASWALYTIESDERVSQSIYLMIETWWSRLYVPILAAAVLVLLTASAFRLRDYANKAKQPTPRSGAADS